MLVLLLLLLMPLLECLCVCVCVCVCVCLCAGVCEDRQIDRDRVTKKNKKRQGDRIRSADTDVVAAAFAPTVAALESRISRDLCNTS